MEYSNFIQVGVYLSEVSSVSGGKLDEKSNGLLFCHDVLTLIVGCDAARCNHGERWGHGDKSTAAAATAAGESNTTLLSAHLAHRDHPNSFLTYLPCQYSIGYSPGTTSTTQTDPASALEG